MLAMIASTFEVTWGAHFSSLVDRIGAGSSGSNHRGGIAGDHDLVIYGNGKSQSKKEIST